MTDITYNLNGGFKPTIKRSADLDGPDFFPTPAWATYALIDNEKFEGNIWECACGDGAMSTVLETASPGVRSSDLYNRGFGEPGIDFLTATTKAANIITNPPYNAAERFAMPKMLLHTCRCGRKTMTPRIIKKCEQCAEAVVIRVRGSNDVPGFEACVKAEMAADLG